MAVVFGAMAVGQSSAFAPDFGEAQLSARRIIKLFDKQSLIDPSDTRFEKNITCFLSKLFQRRTTVQMQRRSDHQRSRIHLSNTT